MKSFYESEARKPGNGLSVVDGAPPGATDVRGGAEPGAEHQPASRRTSRARIAVYDAMTSSPRVEDITSDDPRSLIETLSERTYSLARECGGRVPYTVVREVTENLLHASFSDVVVSILDDGATIRFSDRGPGIPDKERAFRPGFTTADDRMRQFIRGVGSGLPIVRESIGFSGGFVDVEDNLGTGTVVTLTVPSALQGTEPDSSGLSEQPDVREVASPQPAVAPPGSVPDLDFADDSMPVLAIRQKQVLSLVMELGSLGPTIVSRELKVGLSTAYRDLAFLEEAGLLSSDSSGKRVLTERGVDYLDSLMS